MMETWEKGHKQRSSGKTAFGLSRHALWWLSPSIGLSTQRCTALSFIFILQTITICLPPTTLMKCSLQGQPPGNPCSLQQTLPLWCSETLTCIGWYMWGLLPPLAFMKQHLLLSPAPLGSLLSHSQAPFNDGVCPTSSTAHNSSLSMHPSDLIQGHGSPDHIHTVPTIFFSSSLSQSSILNTLSASPAEFLKNLHFDSSTMSLPLPPNAFVFPRIFHPTRNLGVIVNAIFFITSFLQAITKSYDFYLSEAFKLVSPFTPLRPVLVMALPYLFWISAVASSFSWPLLIPIQPVTANNSS